MEGSGPLDQQKTGCKNHRLVVDDEDERTSIATPGNKPSLELQMLPR